MSLIHEVYLVEIKDSRLLYQPPLYDNLLGHVEMHGCQIIKKIDFSDEIFGYLKDILTWIPISIPMFPEIVREHGIQRYGISILDKQSYTSMYNILEGISRIIHEATTYIDLTGNYVVDSEGNGNYEIIKLKKESVLENIREINEMTSYLKRDNYYMIHFGI